ncbi:MAG: hypothetical protein K6E53_03885 [Lachnospiraceae bacterium]|nr:hypothetical protein [Lachnospiraceae bacterium]
MNDMINNHKTEIIRALLLSIVPVLTFIFVMIYDGVTLEILSVPSLQNDEIVYYYEVAGVVDYGMPQGLFGYHEQYSNMFTCGPWSPVLMLNYCIFGFLFGWSAVRAVIYNVIFMSIALFVFGITAKPDKWQTIWLAVLYLSYTFFVQGLMSISPEITCYSYLVIYLGFMYSCMREYRPYKVVILFVLAVILSLMRPYFLALIVMSGFQMYMARGKKSVLVTLPVLCASFYCYAFMSINICSGSPVGGVFAGMVNKIHLNTDASVAGHSPVLMSPLLANLVKWIKSGFEQNMYQIQGFFDYGVTGRNFVAYLGIFVLLLLGSCIRLFDKKEDINKKYVSVFWVMYYIAMAIAVCILFSGWAAERHLSQFILIGILVVVMEVREWPLKTLALIVLLYTTAVVPNGHKEYCTIQEVKEINELKGELKELMPVVISEGPTWDNTVLWLYADYSSGEEVVIPWQHLFAVPSGFGFNLENYYGSEEFGEKPTRSRYVATVSGGGNEQICIENGMEELARTGEFVIYRNY